MKKHHIDRKNKIADIVTISIEKSMFVKEKFCNYDIYAKTYCSKYWNQGDILRLNINIFWIGSNQFPFDDIQANFQHNDLGLGELEEFSFEEFRITSITVNNPN